MTSLSTAMGKEDLHSVWSHVCMCYFSLYLVCVPVLTHVFFHKHEVVSVLKKICGGFSVVCCCCFFEEVCFKGFCFYCFVENFFF